MKLTKGLTWPFLILAFAALMVYLGGLAALQHSCNTSGFPVLGGAGLTSTTPNAAFGLSDGGLVCRRVFRFHWFSFAFVAATILGLMVTAFSAIGLHSSRPFWIGMLAIATILMMLMCETFFGHNYLFEPAPWSWRARWRTAAAGAIMTVIELVLVMLAVGTDWEHRRCAHHGYDDKAHSGVTTGTTGVAVPVQNVRVVDTV